MRLPQQWRYAVVPMGFLVFASACRTEDRTVEITAAIQHVLREDALSRTDVRTFYDARGARPAWVTNLDVSKADAAIHVIASATAHGLDAADYDSEIMAGDLERLKKDHRDSADQITRSAELDIRITAALLDLGHDVALGRSTPTAIDQRWKPSRQTPDLVATLAHAADDRLDQWLDTIRPRHPEYVVLQDALVTLRGLDAAVRAASPQVAPPIVLEDRIRQIELNLERWRWLPDDLGARHLIVNIPSYLLAAREDGRTVLTMRVVVGKPENETPIFSGEMVNVVFSPYWNVPESIAVGETAPAAARDSEYLARNQMEIFRRTKSGSVEVDPATIDWEDTKELKALAFRQKPGARNALGHVKFLFPNAFNVYLHDTPSVSLFGRARRALSHGCVRVAEPETLARYVLTGDPQWDQVRIRRAMDAGIERHVTLSSSIPVHLTYFTVWVDGDDLQFFPDVYGHDAKQIAGGPGEKPQPYLNTD